jgi:hypothetical protein
VPFTSNPNEYSSIYYYCARLSGDDLFRNYLRLRKLSQMNKENEVNFIVTCNTGNLVKLWYCNTIEEAEVIIEQLFTLQLPMGLGTKQEYIDLYFCLN